MNPGALMASSSVLLISNDFALLNYTAQKHFLERLKIHLPLLMTSDKDLSQWPDKEFGVNSYLLLKDYLTNKILVTFQLFAGIFPMKRKPDKIT